MNTVFKTISSSFGENLKIEISGGSHESHVKVIIDGFPENFEIDFQDMQNFLKHRSPGTCQLTSPRKELDEPISISGLKNNITTGERLVFHIENIDRRPEDYNKTRNIPRPSHSDYTAYVKYKGKVNMSGGGPFSGRMTAPLCIAGYLAKKYLESMNIFISAHISSVGRIEDDSFDAASVSLDDFEKIYYNKNCDTESGSLPVLNNYNGQKMMERIKLTQSLGDSVGGTVECAVLGVSAGLGGAMYDGLESKISSAIFGISGVKGIEFGSGFLGATMQGSQNNDSFYISDDERILTKSNNHGGILGGISSGMPILFKVAFKPTPSISLPQESINLSTMEPVILESQGRHDPCIAIRAVPAVESIAAIVILDLILGDR